MVFASIFFQSKASHILRPVLCPCRRGALYALGEGLANKEYWNVLSSECGDE